MKRINLPELTWEEVTSQTEKLKKELEEKYTQEWFIDHLAEGAVKLYYRTDPVHPYERTANYYEQKFRLVTKKILEEYGKFDKYVSLTATADGYRENGVHYGRGINVNGFLLPSAFQSLQEKSNQYRVEKIAEAILTESKELSFHERLYFYKEQIVKDIIVFSKIADAIIFSRDALLKESVIGDLNSPPHLKDSSKIKAIETKTAVELETILLSGGFSENQILKKACQDRLCNLMIESAEKDERSSYFFISEYSFSKFDFLKSNGIKALLIDGEEYLKQNYTKFPLKDSRISLKEWQSMVEEGVKQLGYLTERMEDYFATKSIKNDLDKAIENNLNKKTANKPKIT